MDTQNLYGEALGLIEAAAQTPQPADEPQAQVKASLAAATASLAVCDAVYALRDEIESLKARMPKG